MASKKGKGKEKAGFSPMLSSKDTLKFFSSNLKNKVILPSQQSGEFPGSSISGKSEELNINFSSLYPNRPLSDPNAPSFINPLQQGNEEILSGLMMQDRGIMAKAMLDLEKSKRNDLDDNVMNGIIEGMKFGVYNSTELFNDSVIEVSNNSGVGRDSVNDPRLGSVARDECQTCGKTGKDCYGHLGRIHFHRPLINPFFIKEIVMVLNCVCTNCGGLILSEETINALNIKNIPPKKRLKLIGQASKNAKCSNTKAATQEETIKDFPCGPVKSCEQNERKWFEVKPSQERLSIVYGVSKDNKIGKIMPVKTIIEIFERISEKDLIIMGFENDAHPKDFIVYMKDTTECYLEGGFWPVIPPQVRIKTEHQREHKFNSHYNKIIGKNNEIAILIKESKSKPNDNEILGKIDGLEKEILEQIMEMISQTKENSTLAGKSITDELKGKEGKIRKNMMGKRVNNSGRSVIGPDPTIRTYQIKIAPIIASNINVREKVTAENQGYLSRLLKDGKITAIYSKNGSVFRITKENKDVKKLSIGQTVERHLRNSDWIVYNRQPTLHKQGFMAAEVVIGAFGEFGIRMPITTTSPYNADFDGDEVNLHEPITEEVVKEMKVLMGVPACVMNAQKNKLMIGLTYNAITGAHLLTKANPIIDNDDWNDYVMLMLDTEQLETFDKRLEKNGMSKVLVKETKMGKTVEEKRYDGRMLFSAMLPKNFYYEKDDILIKNGILIRGNIKNGHMGLADGSIPHEIIKRYHVDKYLEYIDTFQYVINAWMAKYGLTISLRDCAPLSDQLEKAVELDIKKLLKDAEKYMRKLDDPNAEIKRKEKLDAILDKAKNIAGKIAVEGLSEYNSLLDGLLKLSKIHFGSIEYLNELNGNIKLIDKLISRDLVVFKEIKEKILKLNNDDYKKELEDIITQIKGMPISGVEEYNNLKIIVDSGSKGSVANISQIRTIVGQALSQFTELDFIGNGDRCSIYMDPGDYSPEAYGFCMNSYYKGMTPFEMTRLTKVARESMLDTQLQVPETGAIRRDLMKSLEDVMVYPDGTVRNSSKQIIQFSYGNDGFNAGQLQKMMINGEKMIWFIKLDQVVKQLNTQYGSD